MFQSTTYNYQSAAHSVPSNINYNQPNLYQLTPSSSPPLPPLTSSSSSGMSSISSLSSTLSGDSAEPVIKQRRVQAASDSSFSHHNTDDDSSSTSPYLNRRTIRVGARPSATWREELRAGLLLIYGHPGTRQTPNPAFWIKIAMTFAIFLLLAGYWYLRPSVSHTVRGVMKDSKANGYLSPLDDSHGADHQHPELPPLTAADITIFTLHIPEANAPPEHNVHIRALHSWITRVVAPDQILVYVRDFHHCVILQILGVQCRVTACWMKNLIQHDYLVCLLKLILALKQN